MDMTRRLAMKGALTAASALPLSACATATPPPAASGGIAPDDEAYWSRIAAHYDVTDEVTNLENAYWGLMSRPVLDAYIRNTEHVNRENSFYARRKYNADMVPIHARVAGLLGTSTDEIVLTRGATEALQGLIGGYRGLKPGDAVMYADLDYDSMLTAMDTLAERNGCSVVRLAIPEPVTHDELLTFYADALKANPKVRLLLLTHVSHRTGLVMPIREIVAMARERGVDCIVDAAHSWGQLDFTVDDLGADFVGFNMHKWIGAPLGVGIMYIRKGRLESIAPNISERPEGTGTIYNRVHTGTTNFAASLSVPNALDFHERVGPANKAARFAYLRNLWVSEMRSDPRLEILTPDDPRLHAGITSIRIKGRTSLEDNLALVKTLLDEHGIFTVHRTGVAKGCCVRITPSLYNTPQDSLKLVAALKTLLQTA
ncbi:aminotransferase class V-fold PLP-dependent enzyme [Hyphomonas oceanitis]|uniref:aminotransferase class V-fold PLP-dependent enzyme n=1 Tax=Hyphomonas oceanitis TaxID=81033 RepID=UPI0030021A01